MSDANTEIEPLLHQIDHPVHQEHPRGHARIGLEIRNHGGLHMPAAEEDGRGQREQPLRLCLLAGQTPFRRLEIAQHAPAGVHIGAAGLGQRKPPCGPGNEPDIESADK